MANDEIRLDAQVLKFKITIFKAGINVGHKTGTWDPIQVSNYKKKRSEDGSEAENVGGESEKRAVSEVMGAVKKFGFYGPDIQCPPDFCITCGVGKCVSNVEECLFIRGLQLINSTLTKRKMTNF